MDDVSSELVSQEEDMVYNHLSHIDEQSATTSVSSLTMKAFNKSKTKQMFEYQRLGFYGRDDESRQVMEAFERVVRGNTSELIIVHSNSGLGKSTLIQKLSDQMTKTGGYVVTGKFDQMGKFEPFSAIVAAFSDLCDLITNKGNDSTDGSCESEQTPATAVHEIVGADVKVLRKLISQLYTDDDSESALSLPGAKALERLTECCCNFLRAISSVTNPVIVHFDDLQWGDYSSLALIKALISDQQAQHVLIVCSHRDGEELGDHVTEFLASDFVVPVTNIELGTLDICSVSKMICDLLGLDEATVIPLAKVVMTKTMGNPFHVLAYLESLEASKHLKQSHSKKWTWNLDRIRSESKVALNVAELVAEKIQRLDPNLQALLKVAACLGFEFERRILDKFIVAYPEVIALGDKDKEICVTDLLEVGVSGQLLNKRSQARYSFAHDLIQQVLYDVIPQGEEKDFYHSRIGRVLWNMVNSSNQRQNPLVFAAAEHLNLCDEESYVDAIPRVEVAKINLEAGRMSKKKSAFQAAADFLRAALVLLDDGDKWFSSYDVSMPTTLLAADIEFIRGNFARCRELACDCLAHEGSPLDKLTASCALVDCLGTQGLLLEAMTLGLDTLKQLGERFPNKIGIKEMAFEYIKTRRMLRGMTDDKILNLPVVTDELTLARLKLASLTCVYTPFLGEEKQILVLNLRVMQLCIREGNSYIAPTAYAMYGLVEACIGNRRSAARFGKLCLKLVDKLGKKSGLHSVPIIRCGLLHWFESVSRSLEPLETGIEDAKTIGDSKVGFFMLHVYLTTAIHSGVPVDRLEAKMRACCEDTEGFVQESALLLMLIRPMWQFALNLQGSVQDKALLSGEAMVWDEFIVAATRAKNTVAISLAQIMQMYVAFIFEDYDLVFKICNELQSIERLMSFHTLHYFYMLCKGCSCFELFRSTKRYGYKLKGIRCLRKLRRLNTVNCEPFVALLLAEKDSLGLAHPDLIQFQYDEAIHAASQARSPHLEAIANERAFLLHIKQRFPCPKEYAQRAIQLYTRWGAAGKVDQLERRARSVRSTEHSRDCNEYRDRYYMNDTTAEPPWAG